MRRLSRRSIRELRRPKLVIVTLLGHPLFVLVIIVLKRCPWLAETSSVLQILATLFK